MARDESGFSMMVGLALLLMMSLIGIAAVTTSVTDMDIANNSEKELRAFYLAEAGVARAATMLRTTPTWRDGFSDIALAGGTYTVILNDKVTTPSLGDTLVAISIAERSSARATIEIKLLPKSIFDYAIFGRDHAKVCGTSLTDSYASDSGTYAATKVNAQGDVGSNGQITVCGNTTKVYGSVGTALAGSIDLQGNPTIGGDTSSTLPEQVFDSLPASEWNSAIANSNAPAGLSGNFSYNGVTRTLGVNPGKTLTLQSGTYYFSDVDIKGTVKLAPGADVKMYIGGAMTVNATAAFNSTGAPTNFLVFGRGSQFKFTGVGDFRAAIYAPNTEMRLEGSCNLYGAIIGKDYETTGNVGVHYDRALGRLPDFGPYRIVSWQEL